MKKKNQPKKSLSVNRETLRILKARALDGIYGGGIPTTSGGGGPNCSINQSECGC